MAQTTVEQITSLAQQVAGLGALVQGTRQPGLFYALIGSNCVFGCKITAGFSSSDMVLALDGDADHNNPDAIANPMRYEQYKNIANVYGEVFLRDNVNTATLQDAALTLGAAPGPGFHRVDIVYAYVGPSGPVLGIAQGAPAPDGSTATDPTLPKQVLPLARVAVAGNATGIGNGDITDLRSFAGRLRGDTGPAGPAGANGINGTNGIDGTNGAPGATWRHGSGAPAGSLGLDGDFYLDDASATVYQRTGGSYAPVANLKGPAGATGATGATGTAGIAWQGAWAAGSSYALNDGVQYNGSSYRSLQPGNSGHMPPAPPGAPDAWWALLAQKGTDGTGSGTVTSVDLSMPAEFAVSGNPITSAGVLTVAKAAQAANRIFAGPASGAAAAPLFRALVAADIPSLGYLPLAGGSLGGTLSLTASTAAAASANIAEGVQPTAPAVGDAWNTSAGLCSYSSVFGVLRYAVRNLPNTWTRQQCGAYTTLTDAATIALDLVQGNFYRVALGGSRTLGEPTSAIEGQSGQIDVFQDATGSRTLAFAWPYVFVGGAAPVLSTGKFALDTLGYTVNVARSGTVSVSIASPAVLSWPGHGLMGGQKLQLATTGALPTGLAAGTTYFAIPIDANTLKLASSLANAQAGTAIATSGSQSGVHSARALTITLFAAKGVA